MTLTNEDIDAIADAVVAKMQGRASKHGEPSIVEETKMMADRGIDPLVYLRSRFKTPRKQRERRAK